MFDAGVLLSSDTDAGAVVRLCAVRCHVAFVRNCADNACSAIFLSARDASSLTARIVAAMFFLRAWHVCLILQLPKDFRECSRRPTMNGAWNVRLRAPCNANICVVT